MSPNFWNSSSFHCSTRLPGATISTDLDTASIRHERNAVVIESNGELVTLVQVAGLIARRILCTVKPGDTLTRGQRYGLIRFGSRVDIYLPLNAVPQVQARPNLRVLQTQIRAEGSLLDIKV